MQPGYNFIKIEEKWQRHWDHNSLFKCEEDKSKPKYYVLEMLPYPSGNIHMGHVRNYSIGDALARYKIKCGYNVLHPMGWDAFGLPAENAAIEKKVHPKKWTYENINNMRSELKMLGLSYDWSKEVTTCDPEYYKQQQKIFLEFLKNDLAYRKESIVNWDPVDQTVLSNEQVEDGKGWRSGAPVVRKKLTQWFIKITKFSEELLSELSHLDQWPDSVRSMQEKWIGKSHGAKVRFKFKDSSDHVEIFTTMPETLFGASFCALSFDHPLALKLAGQNQKINDFILQCNQSSVSEEAIETAEKLGIDTGLKVVNPVLPDQELPLFIANFVLMDYGTGAIFGCPAHDVRDHEFALKYHLPINTIVKKSDGSRGLPTKIEADDIMIHSAFLTNLTAKEAKTAIFDYLEKNNLGTSITQYRLRDWGVSRQRYWGCPIPIIHCDSCGIVPVPEKDLPVVLPEDVEIEGIGNPLDKHKTWKHVNCPKCNKPALRETDTLDTFFDSSWYFLRYCSPKTDEIIDKELVNYWLPVDKYIGGIEHAVLHLLYARFFTKALKECGYIKFSEPFTSLLTQGMVTHMSYKDGSGKWFPATDICHKNGKTFSSITNEEILPYRNEKMSKSKKNVVPPMPIIQQYGADTARLFVLSDSPPEKNLEWTDTGIEGCYKFLNKLYIFTSEFSTNTTNSLKPNLSALSSKQGELLKKTNATIKSVTDTIESMHFNKSIAHIRELTNAVYSYKIENDVDRNLVGTALSLISQLLNPIAPHITEELWSLLGNKNSLVNISWPEYDRNLSINELKKITVQVNGKLRLVHEFANDASEEQIKEFCLNHDLIKKALVAKTIEKIISVPGRLINIVAR